LLQDVGHTWTSFARNASIHTDTFLMISGLLISYSLQKQLAQTKYIDIPREYMSRLMRYSTQFCNMCVQTNVLEYIVLCKVCFQTDEVQYTVLFKVWFQSGEVQ